MNSLRTERRQRVDVWIARGGQVVAANERSARSVMLAFSEARLAEGLAAWATPAIFSWENWVRSECLAGNSSGLVVLNPLQEQALWARVIGQSRAAEGLRNVERIAAQAQLAYRLLGRFAPDSLRTDARLGWVGDAGVFSEWLSEFDAICGDEGLICSARLHLEMTERLRGEHGVERPSLLLVGFDRLLETQRALLNAWGSWELDLQEMPAETVRFYSAQDDARELAGCVGWLRSKLAEDAGARLMVVTKGLDGHRGAIERELMEAGLAGDFEFSLGVSLARVGLVRSALLLMRWLHAALTEGELDWLISSGHSAASADEEVALAEAMRKLRRKGLERTEWTLEAFLGPGSLAAEAVDLEGDWSAHVAPPREWAGRMRDARELLAKAPMRRSPMEWAELTGDLLAAVGWPGHRALGSTAYQARKGWENLLESCASLGFDGAEMDWQGFAAAVSEAALGTIFAAESTNPAILIIEPMESAGQIADGIWFLGANETDWPGRGSLHPLLPVALQRDAGMPHATPQADWELADAATNRLLQSAVEVVFSYSRMATEGEARPSRLVVKRVGGPVPLPEELGAAERGEPLAEKFEDFSRIPFQLTTIEGGSATLTSQSLCPFQAFATARLGADRWEPAEAGLNAKQRGQLLHAVLHQVWSGEQRGGISTLEDLLGLADLENFVSKSVERVLANKVPVAWRETLPARFLMLEAERLTQLVTTWLAYESERFPFRVAETEAKAEVTVANLKMRLRLDRVDVVPDKTALVIDYKTGNVGPNAWADDRPDDIQLPLYATFAALERGQEQTDERVQGLLFARIKPGKSMKFYGRVRDAAQLRGDLGKTDGLVRNPLTDQQLEDWRGVIERLGEDFLHGRADVDPKDGLKTCERCHLQAVCRIYENQLLAALEEEGEETEGDDD